MSHDDKHDERLPAWKELENNFFSKLAQNARSPMEIALACAHIASSRRTMDDRLNPIAKKISEDIDKFAAMLSADAPQSATAAREGPHRAVRIVLDIEADSRKDMEVALRHFLYTFHERVAPGGAAGGYSHGWSYRMWESDRPTHDEWAAALDEYIANLEPRNAVDSHINAGGDK